MGPRLGTELGRRGLPEAGEAAARAGLPGAASSPGGVGVNYSNSGRQGASKDASGHFKLFAQSIGVHKAFIVNTIIEQNKMLHGEAKETKCSIFRFFVLRYQ